MPKDAERRPHLILLSIRNATTPSNPYSRLFVESIPSSFELRSFTWKRALFSRYDAFHVHWPELIFRAQNPMKKAAWRALTVLLLTRLRIRRTPVIRTVHNESPHENGDHLEAWLLRQIDALTSHWIVMNSESQTPDGEPRHLIPHGDYRSWYNIPARNDVTPASLLFFGEIRPYKNVPALCRAFSKLTESRPDASLAIMGRPSDPHLSEELTALATATDRVNLNLAYVPDDDLIAAISEAHLVVLPYARFHNSGAALLTLSVGRPILVPDCPASRELVDEFGDEYIKLYVGELTGDALASALDYARTSDLVPPAMPQRDWSRLGQQVGEIYSAAITEKP